MDVASGPLYQHDRRSRSRARSAAAIAVIVALCLLALLVVTTGSLPPAPASEPVLNAPFRWSI